MELLGNPVRPWSQPLGVGVFKLSGDNLGVVILELLEEPFAVRNDDTPEVVLVVVIFSRVAFDAPQSFTRASRSFLLLLVGAGFGAAACPVLVLWSR